MSIKLAVPKEITPGEHRVAMVPNLIAKLNSLSVSVMLETQAGVGANYLDHDYTNTEIVSSSAQLFSTADIILKVQPPTDAEIKQLKPNSILIGFMATHRHPEHIALLQEKNITAFSMELIPRITRAQSMDALSSQAAVSGYKAALLAASQSNRFFPMLTTAAGTIRPSQILVIGAGVAGLQAIATCHRLGAMVEAYDVRPEVKEQIASLGAKMVDITIQGSGTGGYARELTAEEKQQQQTILASHIAKADVIIATAAIPGKKAPVIITKTMVEKMKPGALIIDIAAESGGNCELTLAEKTVIHNNVTIIGAVNLPSMLARDASDMYAKNLFNFLQLLLKDGKITINWDDEILSKSAVTKAN